MKSFYEVLLYTAAAIACIALINLKSFNNLLDAYLAYLFILTLAPLYLLKRSKFSLLSSFGINRKGLDYLYLLLFLTVIIASLLVYKPSLYPVAFFSFILAPVAEEVAFRGYMVTRLKGYGALFPVLYSGIAFGLAHVMVDSSIELAFLRAILGILLAYIFVISGRLLATVSIHMLFNVYTILHEIRSIQAYLAIILSILLVIVALYDYYSTRSK